MKRETWNSEELDAYTQELIRQVEAEGLLKAPKHFKQETLERSRRLDYQLSVQTKEISKNMQFFFYSLKVGAAVVTALFMLFMIPKELPEASTYRPEHPAYQREQTIGEKLNAGMREFNQMFMELTAPDRNRQTED